MQFDKGTLRLFMQSDEGKLSFMSRKTELLPARQFTYFREIPPQSVSHHIPPKKKHPQSVVNGASYNAKRWRGMINYLLIICALRMF